MTRVQVRHSTAALLELTLAAAVVLTALLGVVRPLVGPAGLGVGTGSVFGRFPSVAATIDPSSVTVRTTPTLPTVAGRGEVAAGDALEMAVPSRTTIGVYDPDLRQSLGLVGAEALGGVLTTAVLALLLLIVRTLRQGDPFVPGNARRLYAIAALVGLGGEAVVGLRAWGEAAVLAHPAVAPYVLHGTDISLVPVAAGLGIAVAAEVFRQGAELREDVEGLV